MEKKEVKLVGTWSSPFDRRVEWALKLKGVEYEYMEASVENKNPKKGPVLIHGGKSICESHNILEYIDQVWPEIRLLPEDPYEKAIVRFWAKFAEEKLTEGLQKILVSEGEEQEKGMKQFEEALCIIEGEAKAKNKFFGGESIGYLDLVLGWSVLWLEVVEEVSCEKKIFDPLKVPSFTKWMEEFKDLPLIKENLPSKDPLCVYLLNIRKSVLALKAKN